MSTTVALVAIAVVVVAVVMLALWFTRQQQQRRELREHFGPEYDRAVDQHGGAEHRAAEELEARKERVEQLHLQRLEPEQSERFAAEWHGVQAHFVDDPEQAVAEADHLVTEVMQNRGYPMGEFEQRAADVSVDHPQVVEHYRAAHGIAARSERGDAPTEDLRQAMVHYRSLFNELIDTPVAVEANTR